MPMSDVTFAKRPQSRENRLVIGFSGWMDGGEVSTGVVEWLSRHLDTDPVAFIDPEPFCVYSFPATMEVSAWFRPHVRIDEGVVEALEPPEIRFDADESSRTILMQAPEPHVAWSRFTETLFHVVEACSVSWICFVGSVGGAVPHTRQPRFHSAVSDPSLKTQLEAYDLRPTNYAGPSHYIGYALEGARLRGVDMLTLVSEIPAYVQGTNPRCIEATVRKLSAMLGLQPDLGELRATADEYERRFDEAVAEHEELAEKVQKLEGDYDNEVFENQMGDLKDWLERRGIRVD
jgi:predicted ATP-grasp superfamily ATP-dependent carboligase